MEPQFEWDGVKARSNVIAHGVSFEEAVTIFYDPFLITFFDELHSDFEDRFVSLGESDQQRILLVIHTDRDAVIRIISVRIATRKERQTYEQQS